MNHTTVIDKSGGNRHIQQCAEESGIDYLEYHSHNERTTLDGFEIETWYNEDASSGWTAWNAFIPGVGSCSGPSLDAAVSAVIEKARKTASA